MVIQYCSGGVNNNYEMTYMYMYIYIVEYVITLHVTVLISKNSFGVIS